MEFKEERRRIYHLTREERGKKHHSDNYMGEEDHDVSII